jgi:hypothetical protein
MGTGLATAMLPPGGKPLGDFPVIIVGVENADPYADHADAIEALRPALWACSWRGRGVIRTRRSSVFLAADVFQRCHSSRSGQAA